MDRSKIEEVVARLKAQHPAVCVGKVPVQFSPDQVRKMLVEVLQRPAKKRLRVEYECGGRKCDSTSCTHKGRKHGYYLIDGDTEHPLSIGYMRVSEMAPLAELLNDVVR